MVAVTEPLLGPDQRDAVGGCGRARLVGPATTAAGAQSLKGQINRSIVLECRVLLTPRFGGQVRAVGCPVLGLLLGVRDFTGHRVYLDLVLEVEEVPGLGIG